MRFVEPTPAPELLALAAEYGVKVNPAEVAAPQALVLAIKPQMLDSAAARLASLAGPDTLVVSVIAGKTIANLQARLPNGRAFVRVMPNTPAAVGRGAAAGAPNEAVTEGRRRGPSG